MSPGAWSELLQWTVIAVLAAMCAGLVYLVADVNRRLGPDLGALVPNDGLRAGTEAPALVGNEVRTERSVRLQDFAGGSSVVVFLSPSCGPCIDLVPGLNKIAESRPDVPIVAVVTPGKGFPYATELSSRIMMVADNKREFLDAFAVRRTPLVYVIDDTGRVAMSSVANDLIDLEDTLNGSVRHQGNSPWVPVKN